MFEEALKGIRLLPEDRRPALMARLDAVRHISHDFGYGVGDDMDDLLAEHGLVTEQDALTALQTENRSDRSTQSLRSNRANESKCIELARRQYSGNAHGIVKGLGVVTCVYANPDTGAYWVIDYRIYDPQGDGLSKLDHVRDMMTNVVHHKGLACRTVLMESWYATKELMLFIESQCKIHYYPLKSNHPVDDSHETRGEPRIASSMDCLTISCDSN